MPPKLHIEKPSISVKRIKQRREKLIAALAEFNGQTLNGEVFYDFINKLHNALPCGILRDTVINSNKSLAGKPLTKALLRTTCWRLAANVDRLSDQIAVPNWTSQTFFEWVVAEIIRVRPVLSGRSIANKLTFRILSGTPTSLTLDQTWSNKKINYLARFKDEKNCGFGFGYPKINRRGEQTGKLIFADARQFFGLHCFLLIDPDQSKDSPIATEIGHTTATTSHNQLLLRGRDRQQTECVKRIPGNPECFLCPLGREKCVYATHSLSYILDICSLCQRKGFVDSTDVEYKGLCVSCARKERLSR